MYSGVPSSTFTSSFACLKNLKKIIVNGLVKIQSLVIFLSFIICLFVCLFYHYSKMPPTRILTLTLPVESWVEGLAKGLPNQPHPDSENINMFISC